MESRCFQNYLQSHQTLFWEITNNCDIRVAPAILLSKFGGNGKHIRRLISFLNFTPGTTSLEIKSGSVIIQSNSIIFLPWWFSSVFIIFALIAFRAYVSKILFPWAKQGGKRQKQLLCKGWDTKQLFRVLWAWAVTASHAGPAAPN